jgi:GDPmannose 4,6-dehydratase
VSPYGCAKAFATDLCRVYRDAHRLFVCSGIAYNHESPRRAENFVTRKITSAAARIAAGSDEVLELGNLDAARDWGWAPEYVEAMWRMLQQETADDYLLATGTFTTVREFARAAFRASGAEVEFSGRGSGEMGHVAGMGRPLVRVNERFYRPGDPERLMGDASKAARALGWTPSTTGAQVAKKMLLAEAPAPAVGT